MSSLVVVRNENLEICFESESWAVELLLVLLVYCEVTIRPSTKSCVVVGYLNGNHKIKAVLKCCEYGVVV